MFTDTEFKAYAEKLAAEIPEDLRAAFAVHGFSKVAAALTGTPTDNERAVYEKIATDFFLRLAERRAVDRGLRAFAALQASK